jgi:hypothetical protein
MNISTIQKRKLLNNLYKLFYSSGTKPNEQEVRRVFNQYFDTNKLGQPVPVEYGLLQQETLVNEDTLNRIMASTALNLEVLYDVVNENNLEMLDVITALNNRLANLRTKRKSLESKVDDLLFVNKNSDGYFYSFTENFSSLLGVDIDKTSAFVDIESSEVTLPKLISTPLPQNSNRISVSNVTARVLDNGALVTTSPSLVGMENIFDGLNDTYWQYAYESNRISLVTLEITIPISASQNISRFSGRLQSTTPLTIVAEMVPADSSTSSIVLVKESSSDYNYFNFHFPAGSYRNIVLRLIKKDPDYINSDRINIYSYIFGIREIYIGSEYYDSTATYVSNPISIPSSDNSLIYIESASIDVKDQIPTGTNIRYYVAADNGLSNSTTDLDWIPITPLSYRDKSFPTIANIASSSFASRNIRAVPEGGLDISLIPLNENGSMNELNPNSNIYLGKTVYKLAVVDNFSDFLSPNIFSSTNSCRRYFKAYSKAYKSLNVWSEDIKRRSEIIGEDILYSQEKSITPSTRAPSSGYITTRVNCTSRQSGVHIVRKNRDDFDMAIYLNGTLLVDLPSGTLSKEVEWNFTKGINEIIITYDKEFSGDIVIEPLGGKSISDYGTIYLDRLTYLDPIEFRNRLGSQSNIFTVDAAFGTKYILSSDYVGEVSLINYYRKSADIVSALRVRADLYRYQDPFVAPSIDQIRVLFKHTDSQV